MIVIDASVAIGWCFADEATPEGDAVLERLRSEGARVPSLWHLEVANVLRQAERRGRISPADTTLGLDLLAQLPIAVDGNTIRRAWRQTIMLARAYTLTVYDAAYLELAMRLGFLLASKDKELLAAARQCEVQVAAC